MTVPSRRRMKGRKKTSGVRMSDVKFTYVDGVRDIGNRKIKLYGEWLAVHKKKIIASGPTLTGLGDYIRNKFPHLDHVVDYEYNPSVREGRFIREFKKSWNRAKRRSKTLKKTKLSSWLKFLRKSRPKPKRFRRK